MSLKNKIKHLIRIVEESNINELEVSSFWGAQKIRVSKGKQDNVQHVVLPQPEKVVSQPAIPTEPITPKPPVAEVPTNEPKPVPEPAPAPPATNANLIEIKAPLVGTFYKSSKPGTPPFVNVGDTITKGQIICIIEAMKIFNEIETDHSGKIVEILLDDSSPVEYDQPLMLIEPS